MLLPSRRARTYPHHARQRRWSETLGWGTPMASTSSPTLISPLRESSRRAESLMGLAKPSRSFASSLTSRTSRPTGISASGAPFSLSGMVTPPFALQPNLVTSRILRDQVLRPARYPLRHHGPHQLTKRL